MNILESLKMATTTLLANKVRSGLTMLGIIIGNASVIGMIGIGEGAQKFVKDQVNSLGPNVLFVFPSAEAQEQLVLADAEAIAYQVPAVKEVAPSLNANELVSYRNKNASPQIIGTTPEYLTVRNFDVAKGKFLTDLDLQRQENIVALGSELAEQLFGNQNPIGKRVRIKNTSLQVVGVMAAKGAIFGNNQDMSAFIPITTMANRIVGRSSPYGTKVSIICVSLKDEDSMKAGQFQIENLLRLRHKITDKDDFTVRNQKDLLQILGGITTALTILLAATSGISLVVGGIGIMNIMLVAVTERTKEIGLRKALGASQKDILVQFIIESVILSVAGGLVGIGIGVSGVLILAALTSFETGISVAAIAISSGVSGAIGLFFGVFPAKQAAKLDPIVALRSM